MEKKADSFDPNGLEVSNQRHYSAANIDLIISTCPDGLPEGTFDIQQADPKGRGLVPCIVDRRTALEKKLEGAARWFLMARSWEDKPPPSEMKKRFLAINTRAGKLLESLGLPDTGDLDKVPLAILDPLERQAEQLLDAIEGVKLLRDWSAKAGSDAAVRVGSEGNPHKGAEPLLHLVGELARIWVEIFEQSIGTSVGGPGTELEGKATGPMVHYIQACLAPLGESHSNDAVRERIRKIIRKIKGMVKSGSK